MKYIEKGEEPEIFTVWKGQQNEDWIPNWDALRAPEKPAVHDVLLREQGYICCYCGMLINRETSHIEHLKPRSTYPNQQLVYANLLASCQRERIQPYHCGYAKDDWYDEHLMVSPLEAKCTDFFRYADDGQILPTDNPDKQSAAATTIDRLGLNIDKLIDMRRGVIEDILEVIDQLTNEEIQKLAQSYEQLNANGEYRPFCAAIAYILKQYFIA